MRKLRSRGPDFICFKDFSTSLLPHLYFPVLFSKVYTMLLLLILFSTSSAYAEETKIYTDADLVNYKAEPMVDQETLSRMEDALKSYEKKRGAASLLEKEKRKRQKTEEAKRPPGKKRT